MRQTKRQTETLRFRRGDEVAHVVTDGGSHRVYMQEDCKWLTTLWECLGYLEAHGWAIDVDYVGQ